MMTQYIIIATILAACIVYAAIRIYRAWRKVEQCHDRNYQCSGCAFYEQCKKKIATDMERSGMEVHCG